MIFIKNKLNICLYILIVFLGVRSTYCQNTSNKCNVTYIANEGFLLETTNHKILVDALFGGIKGNWCDQPSDSVINLMVMGIPPFKNIDIILITHSHNDHFNPKVVAEFLKNNPRSTLICPYQVYEKIKGNLELNELSKRIISLPSNVPFDSTIKLKGMSIRSFRLNHGSFLEKDSSGNTIDLHRNVENFGYLMEVDGFKILHTGDGSPSNNKDLYKNYGLGEIDLDFAMLDRVFLGKEGQELLNATINAKRIILMHIEPDKINFFRSYAATTPFLVVFSKLMEKKDFYN